MSATGELSSLGVSIWLDDLSRERIKTGNLSHLIDSYNVVGVTTNPTIFQQAISSGTDYSPAIAESAAKGRTAEETVFEVMVADVRDACDVFRPIFESTNGVDGRVSIEVSPELAHDTNGTIAQADDLHQRVGRDNVLVKIPATKAGLPAITEALGRGISVNVTLIFSLERYREVVGAFMSGLELAAERGHDLSTMHSVASFFVSRVDTEIDKQLAEISAPEASELRSRSGVANARLAYQAFEELFATERWKALAAQGAHVQRPLWASTGVKDPALPSTLYVTELAVPHTVNTMPEKTLMATAELDGIDGDRVTGFYDDAAAVLDGIAQVGISYDDATESLEQEGVQKFIDSWRDLLGTVEDALKSA